jgi:hypothetical protein
MIERVAVALERIAAAMEQTAVCQKNSVVRSEAMQMASMEGSKIYDRYMELVKDAGGS